MLEEEFKYYKAHQQELIKSYLGKSVVIKGNNVLGVYDSDMEAYQETIKTHESGSFLIMQCLPGDESYSQSFNSRVVFA